MIRRPPRSTLFPYTDALPIFRNVPSPGRTSVCPNSSKERPRRLSESLLRSEEHTSELQSRFDLVCRLLLEKKKESHRTSTPPTAMRTVTACCRHGDPDRPSSL